MPPRFFAPKLSALDVVVTLPLDEAQHLRQVLRLDVGEIIHIFDGKGQECEAKVEYVEGRMNGISAKQTRQASQSLIC